MPTSSLEVPVGAYKLMIKSVQTVTAFARPEGSLEVLVILMLSCATMAFPLRVVPIL